MLDDKRSCCTLLRKLAEMPDILTDRHKAEAALDTLQKNCILMQIAGKSRVKIDVNKQYCQLVVTPDDAQAIAEELGKTIAVHQELAHLYDTLSNLNGLIANNVQLQQITERERLLLAQIREGERKFGRVPDTPLIIENQQTPALSGKDLLTAHPVLKDKAQWQGVPPKETPSMPDNPDAAKNAEELQHRLQNQPKPAFNPRPSIPGQGG